MFSYPFHAKDGPIDSLPSKSVLIVDDNEALARVYQKVLDLEGHRARVVTTREGALVLLGEESPALILLDCSMPGMTLEDFVMRAREVVPQAPILGFSSFSPQSPVAAAARPLLAGYVEKPDDIDRFLDIIGPYLDGETTSDGRI